jgi:ribose transport system permease protein
MSARYGLPVLLIGLVLAFSVLTPDTFANADNYEAILVSQTVVIVVALAAMLPLIVGEFDLSISANAGLSNVIVVGLVVRQDWPPLLSIVAALLASTAIGVVNGYVITRLNVNTVITTLATSSIIAGLVRLYTGNSDISGAPESLTRFGRDEFLGFRYTIWYTAIIAIVVYVILERTATGRRLYATGFGRRASELAGIPTRRYVFATFASAGLLCGIAGVMLGTRLGAASQNSLGSLLIPAFTAAFLGATTIRPGRYNVIGAVIAALFTATAISGLQQMGVPSWVEPTLNGVALIVAVALSQLMIRAQETRARKEQEARIRRAGETTVSDHELAPRMESDAHAETADVESPDSLAHP